MPDTGDLRGQCKNVDDEEGGMEITDEKVGFEGSSHLRNLGSVSITTRLSWLGEGSFYVRGGLHITISHLCQKGSFSSLSFSAGLGAYKRSSRSLR